MNSYHYCLGVQFFYSGGGGGRLTTINAMHDGYMYFCASVLYSYVCTVYLWLCYTRLTLHLGVGVGAFAPFLGNQHVHM